MAGLPDASRQRARALTRKLASSPLLPVLGITKTMETLIAGGPTQRWIAYTVFITVVWIYADDLQEQASEAADAVDDATDSP